MLVIREKQMRAFRAYMTNRFEDRMVLHVKEYFPKEFGALGEDAVRETIRHGIDRAWAYEIAVEHDVSRYINLMFTYGKDFDLNPALSWAAAILNDTKLSGPSRMDRLYEEAEKHLSRGAGIGNTRGPGAL